MFARFLNAFGVVSWHVSDQNALLLLKQPVFIMQPIKTKDNQKHINRLQGFQENTHRHLNLHRGIRFAAYHVFSTGQ